MKTVWRTVFILLVIGALATQITRIKRVGPIEDSVATLGTRLERLGFAITGPDKNGELIAQMASCPGSVRVALIGLDGGEAGWSNRPDGPDDRPLFIYLGAVVDRPDHSWMTKRRIFASMLSVVGARADYAPSKMILAVLPQGCPELSKLDWSSLSP
jgi:hypothetical protein